MNSAVVLQQVAVLFIVMGVGVLVRKLKMISDQGISDISGLVVNITAPALVIGSFQFDFSPELAKVMGIIALGAFFLHLVPLILGKALFRKIMPDQRAVLWFASIFSNAAFIGYPILQSVLGETGVLLGAMYVMMFNIVAFSAGVGMFTGESRLKATLKNLLNPGIICTLIGLALFLLGIRLPQIMGNAISIVGSATTPLSMLVVGARLADIRIKDGFGGGWRFYLSILMRNLALPLLTIAVCKAFQAPSMAISVLALEAAMPVATMTSLFAEKFNGDRSLASQIVFVSTLVSLVTVPLIAFLAH